MNEKETLIEKLGSWINKAGTALVINLLFLLACLPIVTIGQAWHGLMSALRYNIRGDSWFKGFQKGYKTRFWRGTIAWTLLLVLVLKMLFDLVAYLEVGVIVPAIAAAFMFALMAMLLTAFMTLNVYIPTSVGNWIRNSVNMVFKAPLQLLVCTALFWAPVVMIMFWPDIAFYVSMVFIVIYFTLVGMAHTVLLKDVLVDYLVQAREDGTLLAEEGSFKQE